MTTLDAVTKLYGVNGFVNENPLINQTDVTAKELFGGNPQRLQMFAVNLGANPAYVSFDPSPSASNGILLGANGGSIEFDFINDTIIPTKPMYIISPAGASEIYSFEVIAY